MVAPESRFTAEDFQDRKPLFPKLKLKVISALSGIGMVIAGVYGVNEVVSSHDPAQSKPEKKPPVVETVAYDTYTVQPGDSLSQIVKSAYNLEGDALQAKINEIAQLNGITNPALIYVGQEIQLPKGVTATMGEAATDIVRKGAGAALTPEATPEVVKEEPVPAPQHFNNEATGQLEMVVFHVLYDGQNINDIIDVYYRALFPGDNPRLSREEFMKKVLVENANLVDKDGTFKRGTPLILNSN